MERPNDRRAAPRLDADASGPARTREDVPEAAANGDGLRPTFLATALTGVVVSREEEQRQREEAPGPKTFTRQVAR